MPRHLFKGLSNGYQLLADGTNRLQYLIVAHRRWAFATADVLCEQTLRHTQAAGNGRCIQLGVSNEKVIERIGQLYIDLVIVIVNVIVQTLSVFSSSYSVAVFSFLYNLWLFIQN